MSATLTVRGLGVLAPGLAGWTNARDVFAGQRPWSDGPVASPDVQQLPVTERRRVNATSRWAIAVADEAAAPLEATERASMPAVFASGDGDGEVLDQMLAALAAPEPSLSPTLFHNSVFNAPIGYWSIATRSTGWATMICAGEGSVAAALLEGASQALAARVPVLCVCVDLAYPDRLAALRAPGRSFAFGIVLDASSPAGGLATIAIGELVGDESGDRSSDRLRTAFAGNAAAAAIPLLACIARGTGGAMTLPYLDGQGLRIEVGR